MSSLLLRLAALTLCLATVSPALAQNATLVDLRDFSPRELTMGSFTLDAPQTLTVEAIGAEDQERDRWDKWDDWNRDRRWERPAYWPGEAWILDARTREASGRSAKLTPMSDAASTPSTAPSGFRRDLRSLLRLLPGHVVLHLERWRR